MIFLRFYTEFTSLLFLKTKEKGNELLHQAPGTLFSFNPRSLVGPGTEEGRAALFRRGEAPEVEARLGKMERASRTTSRRPWVVGRRLEEAAPRRGAAGGELSHGGGALVRDGGGGRAWEHPGKVEKAMECSIWALEDRGWWFHGELARGGGHGVRRRPLAEEGLMLGSGGSGR